VPSHGRLSTNGHDLWTVYRWFESTPWDHIATYPNRRASAGDLGGDTRWRNRVRRTARASSRPHVRPWLADSVAVGPELIQHDQQIPQVHDTIAVNVKAPLVRPKVQ
jgi:hypothetical protein